MNVKPVATPGLVPASQSAHGQASRASTVPSSLSGGPAVQHPNTASVASPTGNAPSSEDRQMAEQLRAIVNNDDLRVSTRHDDESGRNVVEVLDQATGEVVSQYPTEELIRLYATLRQSLVDKSA